MAQEEHYVTQGSLIKQQREALKNLEEAYIAAKDSARESIDQQIGLWDKMDTKSKTSSADILKNLQSQIDYMANYSANLETLSSRNVAGVDLLVASLSDGTEESAKILRGLSTATDEEISSIVESMVQVNEGKDQMASAMGAAEVAVTDAAKNMDETMASLKGKFANSGTNAVQGFAQSLTRNA